MKRFTSLRRSPNVAEFAPFAKFAAYLPLSIRRLCLIGGVIIGAVCTAWGGAPAPVRAQIVMTVTPTPLAIVVSARATMQAADARATATAQQVIDRAQDLQAAQTQAQQAQQAARDAQAQVDRAAAYVLALDLQAAQQAANVAGQIAERATFSATQALSLIDQARADLPTVITLTNSIVQLQVENAQLRSTIELQRAQAKAVPDVTPAPPIDAALIAFVIVGLLAIAACLAVFAWLQMQVRKQTPPPIVWALRPGDDVIDNSGDGHVR